MPKMSYTSEANNFATKIAIHAGCFFVRKLNMSISFYHVNSTFLSIFLLKQKTHMSTVLRNLSHIVNWQISTENGKILDMLWKNPFRTDIIMSYIYTLYLCLQLWPIREYSMNISQFILSKHSRYVVLSR